MAYVDKINVQGTDYDIHDKRIPDSEPSVNVKPIYCHPYQIYDNASRNNLSGFVFNNTQTPLTLDALFQLMIDIYEQTQSIVRFPVSGYFDNGINLCMATCIGYYQGVFTIIGGDYAERGQAYIAFNSKAEILAAFDNIIDGVNKIN